MEDKTPREILERFYKDNNLELDGGQSSPSVKIEITKNFRFYFPNFNARRKAVIKHDIHHLLTGYSASSISGESEISAWEIASGCKKYWPAFLINTSGVMIGVPINFVGVLKAFSRGRKTKNLYHDMVTTDQALDMKVSELKKLLLLDEYKINASPAFTDFILFSVFALFGIVFSVLSLMFLPFILIYSVYTEIKK
ncbi:MAG TPA: hypothetical protein VNX68_12360 [Nitrosopumilaceae archaeon]|jgi:hypothetical protein|nr:hypothetical protein [Nitrosopumilaceae archaeon]